MKVQIQDLEVSRAGSEYTVSFTNMNYSYVGDRPTLAELLKHAERVTGQTMTLADDITENRWAQLLEAAK